jgi:hypothetical protein
MPKRSAVTQLPPEVQAELNGRLIANGFAGYVALSEWLEAQGYQISKSALQRYGVDYQEEFEEGMGDVRRATQMAKSFVAEDADEQGALLDATARLAQEQMLRLMIELRKARDDDPAHAARHLSNVTRALAELGRMTVSYRRWKHEVEERAKSVASAAEKIAKKGGLTEDAVTEIRKQILGIAA